MSKVGEGVIFFIALVLRLYKLGYNDLWFDEVCSLQAEGYLNVSTRLFGLSPLYYLFLHFWLLLFRNNEFWIRLPSVLFSLGSLLGIFILVKHLWDEKTAFFALAMLSLSPFHIWYAQEARHYALSVLLFILTFLYLLKFLDRDRFSDWFLYTFFFTLGIYTDYYFLLLIFPEFITVLFWIPGDRKIFFKWFLSKMVALIMFSPWLSVFFKDISFVSSTFWPHPANFKTILIMMEDFLLGYTSTPIFYHLALLLVSLILLISGVRLFKIREDDFKYLYIVFIFFVVPVAIAYILGQLWNIFFPRVLIIFSIPFYILFSYGIDKCISYKKNIFFVLIGCLVFLNIHSLWNYYNRKMPAPIMYHEGVH
ncbi:glycosyltransferase family 39 protein, partial [bacterium]|nr:glycosyltransferase family 39 protein [bacterium]